MKILHRPPLNLLRQEIAGTSIYLEILHKSTTISDSKSGEYVNSNGVPTERASTNDANHGEESINKSGENAEQKLRSFAEEKLVSFCGQVLKEASDLQPSTGEVASADVHRILDLRAPVIVKVIMFVETC